VQGFSGGTLIPLVFSAVFLLFPVRLQTMATNGTLARDVGLMDDNRSGSETRVDFKSCWN
jgi:hypothetical protein